MKKFALLIACLHFLLFSYAQPETLDSSFNNKGWVTNDSAFSCITSQPDGKVVVAGHINSYAGFTIARYNIDGTLDDSFDGDGNIITGFNGGGSPRSIAVQPNGKIVVAGITLGSVIKTVIARYNTDGSLDSSFFGNGKATLNLLWGAVSVAVQMDEKIVLAGGTAAAGNSTGNFAVARLNEDGSLDSTFNGTGERITDFGLSAYANTVIIQEDEKIVVVGGSGSDKIGIARYNPDGSLDNTFNGNGKMITLPLVNNYERAASATLQSDGKIIVGGTVSTYSPSAPVSNRSYFLIRFNADGSLDSSFGQSGRVRTRFRDLDFLATVAVQQDGKIVASGSAGCYWVCSGEFALARYNPDGSPDSTFGLQGKSIINFGYTAGGAMAIHHNRIYIVGTSMLAPIYKRNGIIAAFNSEHPQIFITCPFDITIKTNPGRCDAVFYNYDFTNIKNDSINYTLSGATTGNGPGTVNGKTFNKGVTAVRYSLNNDVTKTCSFNITVEDKEAPAIICPPASVLTYNAAEQTIAPLKVTDNCNLQNITYAITGATSRTGTGTDASGSFNPGINTVTWKAEDSEGNSSTCSTIVSINNQQTSSKLSVNVYPNPSRLFFIVTVKSDDTKQPIRVNIYNFSGRVIETKSVMSGQNIIVGYAYSPGNYTLEAVQNIQKEFKLLIKL